MRLIQAAISGLYQHRRTNGKQRTTTRSHNRYRTVIEKNILTKNLVNQSFGSMRATGRQG